MLKRKLGHLLWWFLLVNFGLFFLGSLRFGYLMLFGDDHATSVQSLMSDQTMQTTFLEQPQNCDNQAMVNIPATDTEEKSNPSEFLVPNIVHYIWFNTETRSLRFHHLLSIMSAHKILSPDVIYFHTNKVPRGQYWELAKKIPSFKVSYREPPTTLFGEKIKSPLFYTSHSNVDRVKVLMEYGGIYLDLDTLVIRPFDDLRRYPCTIAREIETKACGCVVVCSKKSFFLTLWINAYIDDYRINEWAYNTGQVPYNLAKRYPHLVHVDKTGLVNPNYRGLDQLWGEKTWDWQKNYAVHLYYRLWKDSSPYFKGIEPDMDNIKMWNSTFGEIARMILFGETKTMDHEKYFNKFKGQS